MSGNYTTWFSTFRECSNEGERQNDALKIYGNSISSLFPKKPELTVVEFGCGKAAKAKALLDTLQEKGINLNYTGLDISDEMLQEAQRAIPNGKFYNHSIFKPVTDAGITLPTADTVLVIHSAYYGYGRDKAAAKDTSELEILLDNVQIASGSGTAVLAMHKSPKESTNGFKEKHSSVVESHATAALGQLMKAKGMKSFSYEFPGEIRVPTFGDVRPMSEKAKELAQFLSHTDINAITPQKAEQICTDFLTLCQKHLFVLPTFTEVSLSTERGASQGFVRGLEGVAKKMQAIASYRA